MGQSDPRPTPMSMPQRRLRGLPSAATTTVPRPTHAKRHSFTDDYPHRGWQEAIHYVDTGIFFAAARDRSTTDHFKHHYRDHLKTTQQVAHEVRNRARRRGELAAEEQALAQSAADAERYLLSSRAVLVEQVIQSEDDATKFDMIMDALASDERQRRRQDAEPSIPGRHAGEASLILRCLQTQAPGQTVVFLSNDGGASNVAARYNVISRHFGYVLRELVCDSTCAFDSQDALVAFHRASEVTKPPKDTHPTSASDLECLAVQDHCSECDNIERQVD